jgi:hypothetical protein
MKEATKLDSKQREAFARMIQGARDKKDSELKRVSETVSDAIHRELAKEAGCLDIADGLIELRTQVDTREQQLRGFGFKVEHDGTLSRHYDCDPSLDRKFEKRMADRTAGEETLQKYDVGILGVWAAEDAVEAKKIVESLLERE